MKLLRVYHTKSLRNEKQGSYRALLDTWSGMGCGGSPFVGSLLAEVVQLNTDGRLMFTGKDYQI